MLDAQRRQAQFALHPQRPAALAGRAELVAAHAVFDPSRGGRLAFVIDKRLAPWTALGRQRAFVGDGLANGHLCVGPRVHDARIAARAPKVVELAAGRIAGN